MKRIRLAALSIPAALVLAAANFAWAHEGLHDGDLKNYRHALHDSSAEHESGTEGHIPKDVNYGLRPVGQDTLGGVETGRYTDVWSDGRGYAYVGTFQDPTCDRSGVYISDISDPSHPTTVTMIESPPQTRVNDVKTIEIDGRTYLIHTLEPCGKTLPHGQQGKGGISIYDVTDPAHPVAKKQNFLDFGVHNTFPWHDSANGRTYLIGVNDDEPRDVFFVDITKPQSPKLLAEVGLPDWPGARDEQSAGMGSFAASFNHDVWVTNTAKGFEAVVSYWDAGFVRLDVDDPADPTLIDDSAYPDPDPISGFSPPEGNGHAAAYNSDASRVLAGDEDFAPFRTTFEITQGPNAGRHPAAEGTFTTPIAELEDNAMNGSSTYLGLGCDPSADLPDAQEDGDELTDEVAVIQRGACRFDTKAQTAINNGYDGLIVFNDEARGDQIVTMAGESRDIPGVFVGHSTGLAIFDVDDAGQLDTGQRGAATATTVEFDGWGYFHMLDRQSLKELGYYAPGQVNDPDYAQGSGDLTMHNVEGAAHNPDVAFIGWYALGMRAVELGTGDSVRPPNGDWDAATAPVNDYYAQNVSEAGRFIAPEGSNFWGVHVASIPDGEGGHEHYVLGSDRNTGLWIFSYDPGYCDAAAGYSCP